MDLRGRAVTFDVLRGDMTEETPLEVVTLVMIV